MIFEKPWFLFEWKGRYATTREVMKEGFMAEYESPQNCERKITQKHEKRITLASRSSWSVSGKRKK